MVLFALVLWQTVSIACGRRKLDEPSEIFRRYEAALDSFRDPYFDFQDEFRWLCEMNSLMYDRAFQESENGKVVRGCSQNSCRKNQHYERRFCEGEDCRWVIHEQVRKNGEKMGNYEAIKECFAAMLDSVQKMDCCKEKAINHQSCMKVKKFKGFEEMADEMRNGKESEYKTYLVIVLAVIFLVLALVYYVRENNDLKRSLKEATAQCERMREELSKRDLFHNIQETNHKLF